MNNTVLALYVYCFRDHTTYRRVKNGIRYYDDRIPSGNLWRADMNSPFVDFLLRYCIV